MAINTRDKRASAAGIALAFLIQPPLPDGGLTGVDKQHAGYAYRGIAAAAPSLDLDGDQATTLGPGAHIQTYFPDDVAVTPTSADLRDCNVLKTLICTRIEYQANISLANDYNVPIEFPADLKTMICTRNEYSTPIGTTNEYQTMIGCG